MDVERILLNIIMRERFIPIFRQYSRSVYLEKKNNTYDARYIIIGT